MAMGHACEQGTDSAKQPKEHTVASALEPEQLQRPIWPLVRAAPWACQAAGGPAPEQPHSARHSRVQVLHDAALHVLRARRAYRLRRCHGEEERQQHDKPLLVDRHAPWEFAGGCADARHTTAHYIKTCRSP